MIKNIIEAKYQKHISKMNTINWERLYYISECERKEPKTIIYMFYIFIEWKELKHSKKLLAEWHTFMKEGYLERRGKTRFYLTEKGYEYIINKPGEV